MALAPGDVAVRPSAGGSAALGQQLHLVADSATDLFAVVLVHAAFQVQHHEVVFAARVFCLRDDRYSKLKQLVDVAGLHFHVSPETGDIFSHKNVELTSHGCGQHRGITDAARRATTRLGIGESVALGVGETLTLGD